MRILSDHIARPMLCWEQLPAHLKNQIEAPDDKDLPRYIVYRRQCYDLVDTSTQVKLNPPEGWTYRFREAVNMSSVFKIVGFQAVCGMLYI